MNSAGRDTREISVQQVVTVLDNITASALPSPWATKLHPRIPQGYHEPKLLKLSRAHKIEMRTTQDRDANNQVNF